jgi:uncharacterized membrane protein
LHRAKLSDFTTLIFADGYYELAEKHSSVVQEWVKNGGHLILIEGGIRAFSDIESLALKTKEAPKKDSLSALLNYAARDRDGLSDHNPGSVLRARADNTHPLAFGMAEYYHSIKSGSDVYDMPEKATAVVWLEDDYKNYGFIGQRIKPRLKKSPIVAVQSVGEGEVIYFVDSPLYRGFWLQGRMLFDNAIFR